MISILFLVTVEQDVGTGLNVLEILTGVIGSIESLEAVVRALAGGLSNMSRVGFGLMPADAQEF